MINNKNLNSGLNFELVKYIFISAFWAIIITGCVYIAISKSYYKYVNNKSYYENMILNEFDSLQSYVSKNDLSINDMDRILDWDIENWYTYIKIYSVDNKLLYDSMSHRNYTLLEVEYRNNTLEEYYSYDLEFKDGVLTVEMFGLFEFKHKTFFLTICIIFGTVAFIIIFLALFSRKLKYISEIEKGIDIIKNGSLEYRLEVKGNDELASLAENVNEMSETLLKQVGFEEKVKCQNDSVVAMLSHDIRTPLTSVICYLDLIADCKYDSKEKLQLYVKNARTRAYQIRNLTENLFAHSVEIKHETVKDLKTINAYEFLSQFFFENKYILNDEGFDVNISIDVDRNYSILVDILEIRRVIDNINSNICKYADKKEAVSFTAVVEDNYIKISQTNHILKDTKTVESYGIGLNSCKNIIKNYNGRLEVTQENNIFKIDIYIPAIKN